jgi:hypothetical protein
MGVLQNMFVPLQLNSMRNRVEEQSMSFIHGAMHNHVPTSLPHGGPVWEMCRTSAYMFPGMWSIHMCIYVYVYTYIYIYIYIYSIRFAKPGGPVEELSDFMYDGFYDV